jgi:hypothetical protein
MDKVGVDGAIFISAFSIPLQRQLCGGSAAGPSRPVRDRQAGRPGGSGGAHYCPPMTISRPGTGSSNPSPSSSESNANLTLPCRAGTRGDLRLGHKLLGPAVKWARCRLSQCKTARRRVTLGTRSPQRGVVQLREPRSTCANGSSVAGDPRDCERGAGRLEGARRWSSPSSIPSHALSRE